MDFDTADFLQGLFDGANPMIAKPADVEPAPESEVAPDDTPAAYGALTADDAPAASQFADWVRRQDATGRWGREAPDLPEWHRWWAHPENVIEPSEPCPRCGSLEKWWDLTGGEHCQRCEGDKLARVLGEVGSDQARNVASRP